MTSAVPSQLLLTARIWRVASWFDRFRSSHPSAWTRTRRRDVTNARRVAGYDDHHHGIVLTASGRITDEPFANRCGTWQILDRVVVFENQRVGELSDL